MKDNFNLDSLYLQLKKFKPQNKTQLRNYIKTFLKISLPDTSICQDHTAPLDYLWYSFSEPAADGDCIVWANRGGGKTQIAAIATVLDCIFKPKCKVRILGGSYEQSSRMYDYITEVIRQSCGENLDGEIRKNGCKFLNGSNIEVLTQSAKSVRGIHVQKLRCDEVELFDADVFKAAQFTTKSTPTIKPAIEVLSTMHKPYGLMHQLVAGSKQNQTPLFQWCMWEVIEKCTDRSCSRCVLNDYCRQRAKNANGYLKIDDCITMMKRSSRVGFETEMLCKRPNLENVVFSDFDPDIHVAQIAYDQNLPLYRSLDFGYVNPFVCLWIQADQAGNIRVIYEYCRSRATIKTHAEKLYELTPCDQSKVAATFCDPAGAGRNDVTGTSSVRELAKLGIPTRYRRSAILEGIELIRSALKDGTGRSRMIISPKCPRLIEALQCYHYPENQNSADNELPKKDGIYDHPIDALRYFFINHDRTLKTSTRIY